MKTEKEYQISRAAGALLGLAVGDALGTTLEFKPKDTYAPLTDMVGGGPFNLKSGQWTDDTAMMLCLADSLIEKGTLDLDDQIQRYVRWFRNGENSCTEGCVGIGMTTKMALSDYENFGIPESGLTKPLSAGNGSLMRIAPIALFFAHQSEIAAMEAASLSSLTTHGEVRCLQACEIMTLLLHRVLNHQVVGDKETFLKATLSDYLAYSPHCHPEIRAIAECQFFTKSREIINGTGYVIASLEAALWCFVNSDTFEEGALLAANLGDDADTTAAIFGQLAGAYYGEKAIPAKWVMKLHWHRHIKSTALLVLQRPSQGDLKKFIMIANEKIQAHTLSDDELYSLAEESGIFIRGVDLYSIFGRHDISTVDSFSVWLDNAPLSECLCWLELLFSQERFCCGIVEENIDLGFVSLWLERLKVFL